MSSRTTSYSSNAGMKAFRAISHVRVQRPAHVAIGGNRIMRQEGAARRRKTGDGAISGLTMEPAYLALSSSLPGLCSDPGTAPVGEPK
jgi:hypothetical protein